MPQLLSLCSRVQELQLLRLACPRAHAPQQKRPPQGETCVPQLDSRPCSLQLEESPHSNLDFAQPKINTIKKKKGCKNVLGQEQQIQMPLGAGRQCKCQEDQIGSGEECGKLEKVWVLVLSKRVKSLSPTPLPPPHCMDKAKTALRLYFSSRQPDCDFWVLLTFFFFFLRISI